MSASVLFVSPHRADAEELDRMLLPAALHIVNVQKVSQAGDKLRSGHFPVVLTEAKLADGGWRDVLALARRFDPGAEVIVTTAFADSGFWAEAINLGAYDLLVQPFRRMEVERIVGSASQAHLYDIPLAAAV